jgi:hypothetical protein
VRQRGPFLIKSTVTAQPELELPTKPLALPHIMDPAQMSDVALHVARVPVQNVEYEQSGYWYSFRRTNPGVLRDQTWVVNFCVALWRTMCAT